MVARHDAMREGMRWRRLLTAWAIGLGCAACEDPEVRIENGLRESSIPVPEGGLAEIRDLSFRGCRWEYELGAGRRTGACRAMAGEGFVFFERRWRLVAEEEQADAATVVQWFRFRTRTAFRVGYGESHVLRIEPDSMVEDFSSSGPAPH
jgi:hypothetical protein